MSERMTIKICGVRTTDIALAAVEAGADYVGLVFAPRSVRCIDEAAASQVISAMDGAATAVGLFVDPDDQLDDVMALVQRLSLPAVQLHGRADRIVDRLSGVHVFRAVAFSDTWSQQMDEVDAWRERGVALAGLIVDTPDPSGVGGGTGQTLAWEPLSKALRDQPISGPVWLAGGLTPDNVVQAIAVVRPDGVDVSSGVESDRGVKDPLKIEAFCAAARSIDAS
jgi:phosphoribosylanthranilate isomerase